MTVNTGSSIALLSSLRQLEEEHAQMNAQLVGLSAKYNSLQHEHACLAESHNALQLEHVAVQQSNEVLRGDLKRMRVELSQKNREEQEARQSSLECFRQLVTLEREASELRESEAATQAKLETLTDEVQSLRQDRDSALERLQETSHHQGSAFDRSMSAVVYSPRGETAVTGASGLTRLSHGNASRRPRVVSEAIKPKVGSDSDASPHDNHTPASKRLLRKSADSGNPDGVWESECLQVQAAGEEEKMAAVPMMLRAAPVTLDRRRDKYLFGKNTLTLKPGLV